MKNQITNRSKRRFHRIIAGLILVTALASLVGAAQYDVEHNFRLNPRGDVVPRVTATYFAHSYIRERREDCEDYAVEPAQGSAFNPYGRDKLFRRVEGGKTVRVIRNRGRHRSNDADTARIAIPATGINEYVSAVTLGCNSWADANCVIEVDPFGAGGRVTGTIRAWGEARAALRPPRWSRAYAFSMTMVEAQGGRTLRNGTIRWRRVVRDIVVGRANSRRQVDPVEYTVTDLETGEVHTGTLYSVLIEVNAGGGGFKWENDTVKIDAQDLRFKAEFPSQFTSLKGELDLHVKNGKVTHSEATGHYAGVLPPVGSSVPLEFPLADDEEFDYDLGDFDGHDLDVNLEFSGAGEAEEERAADPQLTVTPGRPAGPTESVTLTWPPQNCPVVVQQSTNLNQWKDLSVDTPDLQNGLHVVTIPVEPDRETFFRLRTEESQIFDIDPPKFQAHAFCFEPVVMLAFTEAIDPVTARDPSLFLILDEAGQPNQIRDLQLVAPDTLLLFLEHPIQPTQSLKAVILDGVHDRAGNAMRPNYAVPVDCNDSRPSPPEGPRSPDGLHPPGDPALPVDP